MKARDLLHLKAALKIKSTAELVRRLGTNETTIYRWLRDPEQDLPVYIALAAAALVAGLKPFEPGSIDPAELAYYGGDAARRVYGQIDGTHEDGVKADRLLLSTQCE